MNKLKTWGLFAVIIGFSIFVYQLASASSASVVISQIQLGNSAGATNELVEVYNNSGSEVEVTNWCLYYASSTSTAVGTKMGCFKPDNVAVHYFLPAHSYLLAISNEYAINNPGLSSDFKFSATLSGTAGHVRLLDANSNEIDKVGWGTTVSAEGLKPIATAPNSKVISRKSNTVTTLQDTNVNSDDLELVAPKTNYSFGSIYEVQDLCNNIAEIQTSVPAEYTVDDKGGCNPPPVDLCSNIDGMQVVVPTGYGLDQNSDCQQDYCLNINGLQQSIPDGTDAQGNGDCTPHDECPNLLNIQSVLPIGYVKKDTNCLLDLPTLKISELLPNATGSDDNSEYIEIYNPNNSDVSLDNYSIGITSNSSKFYFPTGSHISSGGYLAFYNSQIKFTLVNSTGSVTLKSTDDQLIDQTDVYDNPAEGDSWAVIDGTWQFTNRPTSGSANIASLIEESVLGSTLKPCNANQYRNPDTGRCRLVSANGSILKPCKDGQYRSEETNRCRSIANDVNSLKPCAANQERNPDTNRCRNIASSSVPGADYAPKQASEASGNNVVLWSLIGVAAVAIGYGVWEWRVEIVKLAKKIGLFIKRGK